ncbi:hypothetical protein AVEN_32386-1 [Araneus ventricosus]|uniref:Uncharacterized protein n=1 Tax=Araneus ventricosus TaxID=182803 RepID=A0A4Y2VP64_ARAVE|nr:hypothetical protein AVEN_32386-1 [Araneus ventricosus]
MTLRKTTTDEVDVKRAPLGEVVVEAPAKPNSLVVLFHFRTHKPMQHWQLTSVGSYYPTGVVTGNKTSCASGRRLVVVLTPPCALIAISPGHHPTPFRHTTRTVRRKRKGAYSLSTWGPLPREHRPFLSRPPILGNAAGHHSSDDESSVRRNLAPQRPPCHQTVP